MWLASSHSLEFCLCYLLHSPALTILPKYDYLGVLYFRAIFLSFISILIFSIPLLICSSPFSALETCPMNCISGFRALWIQLVWPMRGETQKVRRQGYVFIPLASSYPGHLVLAVWCRTEIVYFHFTNEVRTQNG